MYIENYIRLTMWEASSFSGITSNPVVGAMSDLLVDEGGTSVFSETTECIPGETYLKSRCKTISTKKKLATEFKWYKNYLKEAGVDHSANTTPGNKQGGLSSIIEKSFGVNIKIRLRSNF